MARIPALLWLWRRSVATALIQPLAQELPYAVGAALEKAKRQKKQKQKQKQTLPATTSTRLHHFPLRVRSRDTSLCVFFCEYCDGFNFPLKNCNYDHSALVVPFKQTLILLEYKPILFINKIDPYGSLQC